MACYACGKFKDKDINVIKIYKDYYERFGKVYYVFRTQKNGDVKIVNKKQFNNIFETIIKPNFHKGAEYFHISEFSG